MHLIIIIIIIIMHLIFIFIFFIPCTYFSIFLLLLLFSHALTFQYHIYWYLLPKTLKRVAFLLFGAQVHTLSFTVDFNSVLTVLPF
jgi:hypothetical protein